MAVSIYYSRLHIPDSHPQVFSFRNYWAPPLNVVLHWFTRMQQTSFLRTQRFSKLHGGEPSIGRRRARRPLTTKLPIHVTLRSDFAYGGRCLMKHHKLIYAILRKASKRFNISIYERAICGNHIHLLVRGKKRIDLQNFFRVVAGHIAQQILLQFPIRQNERLATKLLNRRKQRGGAPLVHENKCKHPKNQYKFWQALVFSRLLSGWGREYQSVKKYIVQNTLEALKLIPYQQRKHRYNVQYNQKVNNTS